MGRKGSGAATRTTRDCERFSAGNPARRWGRDCYRRTAGSRRALEWPVSEAGTAQQLVSRLRLRFPALPVAGTYEPPFRPLTDEEDQQVIDLMNTSGARLVWVGLSTPKQERWMAAHVGRLDANALLGVGAAFD